MPMFDTRVVFDNDTQQAAFIPAPNWGRAFDEMEARNPGRFVLHGQARPVPAPKPVIVHSASPLHRAIPLDQETVIDAFGLEG
jgi:hypothetical protein